MSDTAQIFAFPTIFAAAVQQTCTRGRHPKEIALLWMKRDEMRSLRHNSEHAKKAIAAARENVECARENVEFAERIAHSYRYALAQLLQTQEKQSAHMAST
ncbi:hypothetical protein [Rhodoferax sp. UBA5149]|uniref:hypothetical protein n=1 Tax=Rhodoferax sp. UBA5149 TaxID=1947379 RepID=UPI0025DE12D9|nr:hypothetical protein [Rhodoferax sp. UBA5149]